MIPILTLSELSQKVTLTGNPTPFLTRSTDTASSLSGGIENVLSSLIRNQINRRMTLLTLDTFKDNIS